MELSFWPTGVFSLPLFLQRQQVFLVCFPEGFVRLRLEFQLRQPPSEQVAHDPVDIEAQSVRDPTEANINCAVRAKADAASVILFLLPLGHDGSPMLVCRSAKPKLHT